VCGWEPSANQRDKLGAHAWQWFGESTITWKVQNSKEVREKEVSFLSLTLVMSKMTS